MNRNNFFLIRLKELSRLLKLASSKTMQELIEDCIDKSISSNELAESMALKSQQYLEYYETKIRIVRNSRMNENTSLDESLSMVEIENDDSLLSEDKARLLELCEKTMSLSNRMNNLNAAINNSEIEMLSLDAKITSETIKLQNDILFKDIFEPNHEVFRLDAIKEGSEELLSKLLSYSPIFKSYFDIKFIISLFDTRERMSKKIEDGEILISYLEDYRLALNTWSILTEKLDTSIKSFVYLMNNKNDSKRN